jgi:hypothetical protein
MIQPSDPLPDSRERLPDDGGNDLAPRGSELRLAHADKHARRRSLALREFDPAYMSAPGS